MLNISILFGIVCFREKYWEAQSFRDLIKSHNKNLDVQSLHIVIYDNTDFDYWDIIHEAPQYNNVTIEYYKDSSNSGISAAFNYFAKISKQSNKRWLVFLDQDTTLPLDFLDKYYETFLTTDESIALPKVYSVTNLLSPSNYNFFRTSVIKTMPQKILLKQVTAINSGLMIKTEFYLENGGYNSDLRVDFCDHEFFERINNKNIFADIIDVSLHQEFSSETNNREKSIERYKIYIKDLNVYKKNKNKLLFFMRVDLPHLLKEIYKNKSFQFIKIRINA